VVVDTAIGMMRDFLVTHALLVMALTGASVTGETGEARDEDIMGTVSVSERADLMYPHRVPDSHN